MEFITGSYISNKIYKYKEKNQHLSKKQERLPHDSQYIV